MLIIYAEINLCVYIYITANSKKGCERTLLHPRIYNQLLGFDSSRICFIELFEGYLLDSDIITTSFLLPLAA